MSQNKPRVIKDFEKLEPALQELIRETYPNGFASNLITITNKEGLLISALPFETDEKYYLVKMPVRDVAKIIDQDDDFEEDVFVKETVKPDLGEDFKEEFEGLTVEGGDDDDDDSYDDDDDEGDVDDEDVDEEEI
jgi:hypothetical protein